MSRFINADIELSHLNTNFSYYVISALGWGKARIVIEVDHYKRIRRNGCKWLKKRGFSRGR
jgi:hypothetical protein